VLSSLESSHLGRAESRYGANTSARFAESSEALRCISSYGMKSISNCLSAGVINVVFHDGKVYCQTYSMVAANEHNSNDSNSKQKYSNPSPISTTQ
jgi:hypothetical protein